MPVSFAYLFNSCEDASACGFDSFIDRGHTYKHTSTHPCPHTAQAGACALEEAEAHLLGHHPPAQAQGEARESEKQQ